MILGAGTVLNIDQAKASIDAGVRYIVSPGFSTEIHKICTNAQMPYLPGAVTPTEIQAALDLGYSFLKFFPAEIMGGAKTLKGYGPVFADMQFCATGGVHADNVGAYLALPNVIAVGTSALLPSDVQKNKDWGQITKLASAVQDVI